jgi:hypothetical protein
MIKKYLDPEQATATLYHELRHAYQAEQARDQRAWQRIRQESRARRGGNNYRTRSIEVDAREYALDHSHVMLAKAVD